MATYKEIHGVKVQYRDSDATAVEGDVWYNASAGVLKMYSAVGAWASGGNLNTAKAQNVGFGTQTAALTTGSPSAPPIDAVAAETYDGSSWTEVGDMNTARSSLGGFGISTAGIVSGGDPGAKD